LEKKREPESLSTVARKKGQVTGKEKTLAAGRRKRWSFQAIQKRE